MTTATEVSIKRTARLAGVLYLALLPCGFFSFVYVPSALMVRGDAAATCRNLLESEALFRSGTVSHLLSQVIVVFLALALYRLFEPANRDRALLMVVLALLGPPIAVASEAHNLAALHVLGTPGAEAFTAAQVQAQAMLFLDMGSNGVLLAQVFWGLWLLSVGVLVYGSRFLPRALAIPVAVAGTAYLIDSSTQLLFPGTATVSQYTFVGELALPLWLLTKGVSVERWRESARPASGPA